MKAKYTFEEIRQATLDVIRQLPTQAPEAGLLAGFQPISPKGCEKHYCYDNSHYAAGTTYYRLGVKGVAHEARKNAAGKTGGQHELLKRMMRSPATSIATRSR